MAKNSTYYVLWDSLQKYTTNGLDRPTLYSSASRPMVNVRSDGVPVRNFKQRIKQQLSCTTLLSGTKSHCRGEKMSAKHSMLFLVGSQWVPFTASFDGFINYQLTLSEPGTPVLATTKAYAIASKKFFSKVKQAEQSFSGLQWLGELKQTLKMFKNPLQALRRSAKDDYLAALQRLKRRRPKSWKDGIADTYLEWFYGWRPVMYDIEDAYSTIETLSQPRVDRKMIHAVGRETVPVNTYMQANSQIHFDFMVKEENIQSAKVVLKGLYAREVARSGPSWDFGSTMKQLGFTLENFIPTAWELLPWSFLYDYFSNVGDILETSFVSLADVRWVNRTQRQSTLRRITPSLNGPLMIQKANSVPWQRHVSLSTGRSGFNSVEKVVFLRDGIGPTVPKLQFEVPSSPLKWIAMGALLSQAKTVHPQRFRG
jgi:hypothetical protein